MTDLALETRGLTRSFGNRIAVDEIALAVPQGAIYGFLGPNGSGKTTTIRMILGLLRPDAGMIMVNGVDALADRRRAAAGIGALLEAGSFYPNLSGQQNLRLTARFLGHSESEVDRALAIVELSDHAARRVREYSLGMRQRLGIARALIGRPSLLILDEPTNGLDPDGIVDMRRFLQRLPGETGATIFLSSHLLSEVEQIATHLGILSNGQLVTQGSLEEMHTSAPKNCVIQTDDAGRAGPILARFGLTGIAGRRDVWRMPSGGEPQPQQLLAQVNAALVGEGIGVFALVQQPANLEDFFRLQTGSHHFGDNHG